MEHDEYISEGYAMEDHDWGAKWSLQAMMGISTPITRAIDSYKKIVRDEESNLIKQAKARYEVNLSKKVGEICCCPSCGKDFKKKTYQQKFHAKRCKDIYWNSVDPVRRERATLFSQLKPKYK